MKRFQIETKLNTADRRGATASTPAVFGIHVQIGGTAFPSADWTDFGVVILGWWAAELQALEAGQKDVATLRFMDGPYEMRVMVDSDDRWPITARLGNAVNAAFWVKEEEGFWYLYVVTDLVERDGTTAAYRAVHASLDKLGDCGIAGSEIKVISPNNAIAKDVLTIVSRYPRRLANRLGGRSLGSTWFDEVYIYPPRVFAFSQMNPMTTEDISHELLRLMNRGPGILQPSRIGLHDGTTFSGVPFSLELGPQNAMLVRFVADGDAAPRIVRLDDIVSVG